MGRKAVRLAAVQVAVDSFLLFLVASLVTSPTLLLTAAVGSGRSHLPFGVKGYPKNVEERCFDYSNKYYDQV